MGWWDALQESLYTEYPDVPLLIHNHHHNHNASSASASSPPAHARHVPRFLRPVLTRTHRFIYSHFKGILLFLFASTVLVVIFAISSMSLAQARLLKAHSKTITGEEHVWIQFPKLHKYYTGMYSLVPAAKNEPEYPPMAPREKGDSDGGDLATLMKSRVFDPYPKYNSDEYRNQWEGEYKQCSFGDRERPEVRVFDAVPNGMPDPVFGSHELLGLDASVCYDRYGRLGGYGYGYTKEEGGLGEAVFPDTEKEKKVETGHGVGGFPLKKVDWRGVDWGQLQRNCGKLNEGRFEKIKESGKLSPDLKPAPRKRGRREEAGKQKSKLPRTAVLIRTWTGQTYTPNDIANLRSLISELSLLSGGEYTVYILLHVKDPKTAIWDSPQVYEDTLKSSGLPEEFWGLAELWNEPLMKKIYERVHDTSPEWKDVEKLSPDKLFLRLPVHGVYRSTFMPVQWFSQRHPEYDFVWNWEIDIRTTGHWYHLFSQLDVWTTKQPREGLWERNGRYYVPSVHGSWADFVASTAALTNDTVLGPVPVDGVKPVLPTPPNGVGEPADLIVLNPLFDPEGATWILRNDVTGYPASPPRRTAIIAASRLSRRLLDTMHHESVDNGRSMFSEMYPGSVALQHGLKAVFAPHPAYMDRKWPVRFLEKTFNNGKNRFTGGSETCVFGFREHNFDGSTWYYNARFARELYKAWEIGRKGAEGELDRLELGGRMCLKAMLLHPIK